MNRSIFSLALLALLSAVLLLAGIAGAEGTKTVAKVGGKPEIDEPLLANLKGRTLYTLSNERNKFVCKAACLKAWPPLVIPKGVKPLGPVKLSSVKRPDGKWQVTRKGLPLYTYVGDAKKGDVNGEGLRTAGGTWHAVHLSIQAPPPPTQQQPPNPYGY